MHEPPVPPRVALFFSPRKKANRSRPKVPAGQAPVLTSPRRRHKHTRFLFSGQEYRCGFFLISSPTNRFFVTISQILLGIGREDYRVVAKGIFARQAFTGFGPSRFWPAGEAPRLAFLEGPTTRRLRRRVREEGPRAPGVYGMVDGHGQLVYVGKAKCLRTRLLSYFRSRSRDPKAGHILKDACMIVWEAATSEFAALLRELELIQRWQPRWNVQGQPLRMRRCYVCVGRQPAPQVFLARKPPRTASAVFGPIPAGRRSYEVVRRLNDWFRLRDCPQTQEMIFAEQPELFPLVRTPACMRHDLGHCLAPCAAHCTQSDYRRQIDALIAFLEGRDSTPLDILRSEMEAAAAALVFERAAALRDRLGSLTWLDRLLDRVRQARTLSFLYPVRSHAGGELWYLIHHGIIEAIFPAPHDKEAELEIRKTLSALLDGKPHLPGPPTIQEIDVMLLVEGWFRRNPVSLGLPCRLDP